MQCPCQQDFFVFRITPSKEKPVPKDHTFKRFLLNRHTHLNKLQLSAAGLFKFVYSFVTTRHGTVENCSNMIFSALRSFLMVLLSESINGPVSNV